MSEKLRKLKDEAAALFLKGKFDKALVLYQSVLKEAPKDLNVHLKCGDIFRKLNQPKEAISEYTKVAAYYAEDGLLLKAIAACKLILEIDPHHTETQKMLAELYAKKTGKLPTEAEQETKAFPNIPLFSDLPKNAFIQVMEQMRMRNVTLGEVIIREGDVDDSMFIISSGKVKVVKNAPDYQHILLAYLSEGAFFGEMALLSEAPRIANVIAEEETVLFEVSRTMLDEVVKNFPSVKNVLLKFYRQRLLNNLMATSPMFKLFNAEQRKFIVEQFKGHEVPAHEKLLEQGQKGDGLYVLLSGKVEVSTLIDGKKKILAHLKEGDVFGEMSLIFDTDVNATIKTLRKSVLLKLPRKTFTDVVAMHPQLLEHIQRISKERQKMTQAMLTGEIAFIDEHAVVI